MGKKSLLAIAVLLTLAGAGDALAGGPQLQWVWTAPQGYTPVGAVLFIHGKADCSTSMTDCNSADATTGPVGYWTNSNNNHNLLNEGITKLSWNGSAQAYAFYDAFTIGYDMRNKSFWDAANDVGACIQDFYSGTNATGCNPSHYQRTSFHIVTHSAGATVIDRLLSTGWYSINSHITGGVLAIAPALVGSRASSALYGADGYSNFCSTLVSWLAGWAIKDPAAQSLTRGAVLGEAKKGYAGQSPRSIFKITTTGGGGSANNNNSASVNEHDNDSSMGALASCLGYSSSDDMDGLLYWSDSDPTNNTSANGCPTTDHSCHYYSQFNSSYQHWFESWANHSHSRDDAYTTAGDHGSCTASGCTCYFRSPGTCLATFGY